MWAVIGGRLNFIQFLGNDSEPAQSGPGIAQQLHNIYDQYLQHFENAYVLTVKNKNSPTNGSPQQPPPTHQMNPNPLVGNSATPGISGNPTEMPSNPPRQLPNQQLIAAALRYVFTNAQDMRAQRVSEHMIAFVERHRPELRKLYQQQVQLLTAKRNAEQEQQNIANGQGPLPNMHEQAPVGLQPLVQRPPQPNTMVGVAGETKMANGSFVQENVAAALQKQQPPTQDEIQRAMTTIGRLKHIFQQRSEFSLYICRVATDTFKVSP